MKKKLFSALLFALVLLIGTPAAALPGGVVNAGDKTLAAPAKIKVKKSGGKMQIRWKKVPGAKKYRVLYRTTGGWKKLADTKKTKYVWKKAKKGKMYSFTVSCVSANGKTYTSDFDQKGVTVLVPMKELYKYSYFKKYMTEKQFKKAYKAAVKIVKPLASLSREEQLMGICIGLRERFDSSMSYSMKAKHYNDPYGYLVLGSASCAGCARTTGLCLNILGIKYQHINENKYTHQWARVKVGKEYWICDAYGLCCGPEPAPKQHPMLMNE